MSIEGPGLRRVLHLFLRLSTPWFAFSTTPPPALTSHRHIRWHSRDHFMGDVMSTAILALLCFLWKADRPVETDRSQPCHPPCHQLGQYPPTLFTMFLINFLSWFLTTQVGLFIHNLTEEGQRRAFLDTRDCIAARLEMEDENEKLERCVLVLAFKSQPCQCRSPPGCCCQCCPSTWLLRWRAT